MSAPWAGPSGDPVLGEALARELTALAATLEGLTGGLAEDPGMLRRHMVALQAIDRVAQTQHAIAGILRADGPVADRLAGIGLEELAERLRDDVGSACAHER